MANTMMDLDFTGVESYSLIPLGTHTVKVKDAEFKKAQTTGSDMLEINFETSDGATRKAWFSLVPQALWKVKQVLEALGVSCEGKIRLNTKTLVGKTCQITVETDANDESRQIITRVSKIPTAQEATDVTAPPFIQPTPAPMAGNNVAPTNPSPSEPVTAFEQPEPSAPQGNLPPWMQNVQNNAPQGNLPPWMRPKQ